MRGMSCLAVALAGASIAVAQASAQQQPSPQEQPKAQEQRRGQQTQDSKSAAQPVKMADLQRNATQYVGKEITVEAEVQDVIGPRLLTIDDSEPFDLDGNLLVMVEAPFAGLVGERSRVTVTGTVKPLVRAEIDRELRWIDPNTASVSIEFERRPMLVARSTKSSNGMELTARVESDAERTTVGRRGTSGTDTTPAATGTSGQPGMIGDTSGAGTARPTGTTPVEDLSQLTRAVDMSLVGRDVNLSGVRVARAADKQSFWVTDSAGGDNLLVVPVAPSSVNVKEGDTVAIKGVIMQMPRAWQDKFSMTQGTDERIYVFASGVRSSR